MATAIDRRGVFGFLTGIVVGTVLPAEGLGLGGQGRGRYAAACKDKQGRFAVVVFEPETGKEISSVVLPERGHGIAVRPTASETATEYVTFARQPGNFAVVVSDNAEGGPLWFTSRPDRHFHGHGVFSADGHLLFTAENDFDAGAAGRIGVRDATSGYRQIGEFPSGGVDPHDMALLPDNRTLVVANGGIKTHPSTPRLELNLPTMQPSLAYIDSKNGDILERHDVPPELHQLSLRHLCVGAGGTVVFGCQFKGARWDLHAIIGRHRRGRDLEFLEMPHEIKHGMRNYAASVAADRRGETAVITAPRGGIAVAIDIATGRYLSHHAMEDVFGVAPQANKDGFLISSGLGALAAMRGDDQAGSETFKQSSAAAWDNHLVTLG